MSQQLGVVRSDTAQGLVGACARARSAPLVAVFLVVIVQVSLALAAAQNAGAVESSFLSRPDAEQHASSALSRRPFFAWRARAGGAVRCRQRINRHHLRCRAAWAVGDAYFWGSIRIWYERRGDGLWWNYAYKITFLDDYCYQVQHRSWRHCTRTFRVR